MIIGVLAIAASFAIATPKKHVKGKDGYEIPTDGSLPNAAKLETDHLANFIAGLPFYCCFLLGSIIFGYGVTRLLRIPRESMQAQEGTKNLVEQGASLDR